MANTFQMLANDPAMTDNVSTMDATTMLEGPRTFYLFQKLPQELQDLIWDAATRSAYEPFCAITAETPRQFCAQSSLNCHLETLVSETRLEFVTAGHTLRKRLYSLLLVSKGSNKQAKQTLDRHGLGKEKRRVPLLKLSGWSRRYTLDWQIVMAENDIICLDHGYLALPIPPESRPGAATAVTLGNIRHTLLSMMKLVTHGPLQVVRLLTLTPRLETMYIDVSKIGYNVFGYPRCHSACLHHGIDFKRWDKWLCDLPLYPLPEHDVEESFGNEGEMSNGSGVSGDSSSKEVTQEGERATNYFRILDLLEPQHRLYFLEIWALFAQAGVKIRMVAQRGARAEHYRQEEFLVRVPEARELSDGQQRWPL
ncbi:hypothetical protein PG999_003543 [Apiospora kogelbergensis]|uniref:F-box domain-containing protein n=1 Tax=Apiospora kogelbergensis TaxID=1337665 RepID=A0AAW0R3Y9_9PEZI